MNEVAELDGAWESSSVLVELLNNIENHF